MSQNILRRIRLAGIVLVLAFSYAVIVSPDQTMAAAPPPVNLTLQDIFLNEICPALQKIHGETLSTKCLDYRYQKDLDKAETAVCNKYARKLKSQCQAYTEAATASSGDPAACVADPTLPSCGPDPSAICGTNNCDLVGKYVNPLINTLSVIFGLIVVISIILGGIQYSTSEGDPQKASKAKNRIANTIFALFAYALLYAFLQFLVPGGIFN